MDNAPASDPPTVIFPPKLEASPAFPLLSAATVAPSAALDSWLLNISQASPFLGVLSAYSVSTNSPQLNLKGTSTPSAIPSRYDPNSIGLWHEWVYDRAERTLPLPRAPKRQLPLSFVRPGMRVPRHCLHNTQQYVITKHILVLHTFL